MGFASAASNTASKIFQGGLNMFKGSANAAGILSGSAIGNASYYYESYMKTPGFSSWLLNTASEGAHKHAFVGAAAGLATSAVGLGLHGMFSDNIDNEGPIKSMLKGAAVGTGAYVGMQAIRGINESFSSNTFAKMALAESKTAGIVGRGMLGTGKLLGSRFGLGTMMTAGAIGASTMLLKSIISTNLTKPNN